MKYGFFDNINREYVIDRVDVPVSWTNYIGVGELCAVISQNAGGYLFCKNPQNHRISRFRQNGVPLDRPGHYIYIRDDDTSKYWSVSWQPVGLSLKEAEYSCRHGLSYSKFSCRYNDIQAEQTLFIPINDEVELWDVKIKNTGSNTRNLSVFSYMEFSFHNITFDNQDLQMSLYSCGSSCENGVIEYDIYYDPQEYVYFTSSFEPDSYDCVRDSFIGVYHNESNPQAVERGMCSGSAELGGNHCASLHKKIVLKPDEEIRLIYMVGEGRRETGLGMKEKYSHYNKVDEEFELLRMYWRDKLSRFECATPSDGMNTMINIWNLYQSETNLVRSRFASFVEVGGRTGLGYRDTAQDILPMAHTNPEKCSKRIIELLRGQVSMGYGLHLFDPEWFEPDKKGEGTFRSPIVKPCPRREEVIHGIEDACSDDALWLIPTICEYVKETGDYDIFSQVVPFADKGEATVYEHMKRIIDFSGSQTGKNGICKGLRADWNDCLNLGGGESAMVSFLLHWALNNMIEIAALLNIEDDLVRYKENALKIKESCEEILWDGQWYIRGITSKGVKIGTNEDAEGKVHLESNTWAVVSGAANKDKAVKCMDSVYEYLYSEYGLHLNAPAYSKPDDDIGFVTRVYKGIKENGAIFSHPNPWAWVAECMNGRGDRAMEYYDSLLPYNQNDKIEIRQAEPYSYCQFIMGREHTAFGRARHPWLTGSAGWAYYAATHWILGIRPDFNKLVIDPCIPRTWEGFTVSRVWRDAVYDIKVQNPDGVEKGVVKITLNGKRCEGAIPLQNPGSVNEVVVIMGKEEKS